MPAGECTNDEQRSQYAGELLQKVASRKGI